MATNGPSYTTIIASEKPSTSTENTALASHGIPCVRIVNIVSNASLGCELDIKEISRTAKNCEYAPSKLNALILRIQKPHATATLFRSGKIVCTGTTTEEESRTAARKFARMIQKLGHPVQLANFRISNIVGTCDLKFKIRLHELAQKFSMSYESELFPGCQYKLTQPPVSVQIFSTGKLTFTGAKSRMDLQQAFDTVYPMAKSCKMI